MLHHQETPIFKLNGQYCYTMCSTHTSKNLYVLEAIIFIYSIYYIEEKKSVRSVKCSIYQKGHQRRKISS